MRHQKTSERQMFPQEFPQGKNGGETKQCDECVITPFGTEPMTPEYMLKPLLDEIWEKIGNPETV